MTGCNPYLSERERLILDAATVGIAGAGGLGSNCAAHLLRSGVRKLVVADFDRVAESNLNRQFYFASQCGAAKVDALRENLLRIDPGAQLEFHDCRVTESNATAIFGGCDIVVEAFDHSAAKMMLIHAMLRAGKRVVGASGMAGWGASNRIGVSRVGDRLWLVGDCEREIGVAGRFPASPRVGIVSAMQANTVMALLLDLEI